MEKELKEYIEEVLMGTLKIIKVASQSEVTSLLLKRACSEVFNEQIKEEENI